MLSNEEDAAKQLELEPSVDGVNHTNLLTFLSSFFRVITSSPNGEGDTMNAYQLPFNGATSTPPFNYFSPNTSSPYSISSSYQSKVIQLEKKIIS